VSQKSEIRSQKSGVRSSKNGGLLEQMSTSKSDRILHRMEVGELQPELEMSVTPLKQRSPRAPVSTQIFTPEPLVLPDS
jgi:hypothetical protein